MRTYITQAGSQKYLFFNKLMSKRHLRHQECVLRQNF